MTGSVHLRIVANLNLTTGSTVWKNVDISTLCLVVLWESFGLRLVRSTSEVTLEGHLRGRYSCLERIAANSSGSVQLFGADAVSEL
jgi:hypothetical protein